MDQLNGSGKKLHSKRLGQGYSRSTYFQNVGLNAMARAETGGRISNVLIEGC